MCKEHTDGERLRKHYLRPRQSASLSSPEDKTPNSEAMQNHVLLNSHLDGEAQDGRLGWKYEWKGTSVGRGRRVNGIAKSGSVTETGEDRKGGNEGGH